MIKCFSSYPPTGWHSRGGACTWGTWSTFCGSSRTCRSSSQPQTPDTNDFALTKTCLVLTKKNYMGWLKKYFVLITKRCFVLTKEMLWAELEFFFVLTKRCFVLTKRYFGLTIEMLCADQRDPLDWVKDSLWWQSVTIWAVLEILCADADQEIINALTKRCLRLT